MALLGFLEPPRRHERQGESLISMKFAFSCFVVKTHFGVECSRKPGKRTWSAAASGIPRDAAF